MTDDTPPDWFEEQEPPPLEGEHQRAQRPPEKIKRLTNCVGCGIPLGEQGHPQACAQCLHWHNVIRKQGGIV